MGVQKAPFLFWIAFPSQVRYLNGTLPTIGHRRWLKGRCEDV